MKIRAIRSFLVDCYRTNWLFVKVETDEGVTGIGSGDTMDGFAPFAHLFVGEDPLRIARHVRAIETIGFHAGRYWPLEVALWDIVGKVWPYVLVGIAVAVRSSPPFPGSADFVAGASPLRRNRGKRIELDDRHRIHVPPLGPDQLHRRAVGHGKQHRGAHHEPGQRHRVRGLRSGVGHDDHRAAGLDHRGVRGLRAALVIQDAPTHRRMRVVE